MMRSLYSGVVGLKTHQTKMDVIGNNIANVNTTAYKAQTTTFSDLMYQTTKRASGASAVTGVGGTNANQIGLGVKLGAISTNITTSGAAQTTNLPFDIMITGDAFFVVNNGYQNYFTRAGSFYVDGSGNLAMTSTGFNVMGWYPDSDGQIHSDTVRPLRVITPENQLYEAEATSMATVSGTIDKMDPDINSTRGKVMNLEFFDDRGDKYTARFSTHAIHGDVGLFYVKLDDILDANGVSIGAERLAGVSFGSQVQTVDTSISYLRITDTTMVRNITITKTGATTSPIKAVVGTDYDYNGTNVVTPGTGGTAIAAIADVEAIYGSGVLANANPTGGVSFDPNGNLIVKQTDGRLVTYPKLSGTTAAIDPVTVTANLPATETATFDVGVAYLVDTSGAITIPTGGSATAVTPAIIEALYGISLTDVREFKIGPDGALTVTRKDVHNAALLEYDSGNGKFYRAGGDVNGIVTLGFQSVPTDDMARFHNIAINFSPTNTSNVNGRSTIGAEVGGTGEDWGKGTGRMQGELLELVVQDDGKIYANYSNGQSRLICQIAVATFANASGLEKSGDNLYSASMNSGNFDGIGQDIKTTGGYMTTGVLEMSNVDLSAEFTEMITTQRGFQANSRIITVSDSLLEELTNLKR